MDEKLLLRFNKDTQIRIENKSWKYLNFGEISVDTEISTNFDILFAYSFDNDNFSDYKPLEYWDGQTVDFHQDLYISIYLKCKDINHHTPLGYYQQQKLEDFNIIINAIIINGKKINRNDLSFIAIEETIIKYPTFNIIDNAQSMIERWQNDCVAVANIRGFDCIYFRTEPAKGETIHTLANHVIRDVVDIKRMKIMSPNNELPYDRNIYTDWDFPLQDEFVVHVIKNTFELAFGENLMPNEKDYLYIPLINKMFRVTYPQPVNKFLGAVGWYEVFLGKYEEDETVRVNKNMFIDRNDKSELSDILSANDSLFDDLEYEDTEDETTEENTEYDQVLKDRELFVDRSLIRDNDKKVIDEYNDVTEGSNILTDNSFIVSLKETEKIREFYDSRLIIVSVNSDISNFPINMYDCSTINRRTIALSYNLKDYTTINKKITTINSGFELQFNFVLLKKFSTEILTIGSDKNIILMVSMKRNKMQLQDALSQKFFDIDFDFEFETIYSIVLIFDNNKNYYGIKIIEQLKHEKSLSYQNIYKLDDTIYNKNTNIQLSELNLIGGNYYISDLTTIINGKKIFTDYCKPLLINNQYSQ